MRSFTQTIILELITHNLKILIFLIFIFFRKYLFFQIIFVICSNLPTKPSSKKNKLKSRKMQMYSCNAQNASCNTQISYIYVCPSFDLLFARVSRCMIGATTSPRVSNNIYDGLAHHTGFILIRRVQDLFIFLSFFRSCSLSFRARTRRPAAPKILNIHN